GWRSTELAAVHPGPVARGHRPALSPDRPAAARAAQSLPAHRNPRLSRRMAARSAAAGDGVWPVVRADARMAGYRTPAQYRRPPTGRFGRYRPAGAPGSAAAGGTGRRLDRLSPAQPQRSGPVAQPAGALSATRQRYRRGHAAVRPAAHRQSPYPRAG